MHIDLYEECFAHMQQPIHVLEIGDDSPLFNDYFDKSNGAPPFTVIIDHNVIVVVDDAYATFCAMFYKWDYTKKDAVYIIERLDSISSAQALKSTIERHYSELVIELVSFLVGASWDYIVLVIRHRKR